MIHRDNYRQAEAFFSYLADVAQLSPASIVRYRSHLKHLLLWADEVPLAEISAIRPPFPTYLAEARLDSRPGPLAPATAHKIIQVCKRFLRWAKQTDGAALADLSELWIDGLKPPRIPQTPNEHEFVSLDEIRSIAALEVEQGDVILERDRAAACLLYLSGMRAGAFVSLPLEGIDLAEGTVRQWPSLGVRTKGGKSATTFLLNFPELLAPVREWDRRVRRELPDSAMWYTPTINAWGHQRLSPAPAGASRHTGLRKRMHHLLEKAGQSYRSPHKFRHGHAVVALQHAATMADYKAVSMNLMHSDIRVTDGIYAPLAGSEVRDRIRGLMGGAASPTAAVDAGPRPNPDGSLEAIARELIDLAHRLAA